MEHERDAADDIADEEAGIDELDDDAPVVPADAPEADVLEQHREARPSAGHPKAPKDIPADVPEADALDQSRAVPADDEDARGD